MLKPGALVEPHAATAAPFTHFQFTRLGMKRRPPMKPASAPLPAWFLSFGACCPQCAVVVCRRTPSANINVVTCRQLLVWLPRISGYYVVDKASTKDKVVFNQVVALKETNKPKPSGGGGKATKK